MKFLCRAILIMLLALPGCVRFQEQKLDAEKTLSRFEERSLESSNLLSFLEANQISKTPDKWDLDTLTLVAFYYHPTLDFARAQWSSAQAGIRTAGARPNPTVGVMPGYNFNAANGVSPWLPIVNFDLPIETAGKRKRRIQRAEQLSTVARLNIVTTAWQVRSNLRISLLDLIAAQLREEALEMQLKSGQAVLQLMEQRLLAGAAASTELFPARLTVLKTRSDLIDLKRQMADARARVADAAGVPLKAIETAQFEFPLTTPVNWEELSSATVRREALLGRADLRAALAEYEASQAALQVEIARQYPDIHLGNSYQWDQEENKWNFGVTFELPVLNRNQGPIAEAEAKRVEAAARFTALQAKAISEIDRAVSSRNAVVDQIKEAEKVVETHRQQISTLEAALKEGAADRVELETAGLELRSSELVLLELKIKAQQALGQLEDALQRPFDSLRSVEKNPRAEEPGAKDHESGDKKQELGDKERE